MNRTFTGNLARLPGDLSGVSENILCICIWEPENEMGSTSPRARMVEVRLGVSYPLDTSRTLGAYTHTFLLKYLSDLLNGVHITREAIIVCADWL